VDIFELRVKTQQLILRTRRLRTQIGRIDDLIAARENAINKTHEQQTSVPAVATDHSKTIGHVQRSVRCAANALEALKEDINKVVNDDRTYLVKELEEEGRVAYCENLRLNARLVESKAAAEQAQHLLEIAATRASEANKTELESQIRTKRQQIFDLQEKAIAYSVKSQKIEIERTILEHEEQAADPDQSTCESFDKLEEIKNGVFSCEDALTEDADDFAMTVSELRQIIEDQRTAIVEHLRSTAEVNIHA
jgi:hypothetical protein